MMRKTTILTLTLSLLSSVQLWAKDYRVSDFGAVADGTTLTRVRSNVRLTSSMKKEAAS